MGRDEIGIFGRATPKTYVLISFRPGPVKKELTMEKDRTSLTGLFILRLAVFTILITLAVIGLYLFGYIVAAAILGTATVALCILFIVMTIAYVTRCNTIETMKIGAEIALRAQATNDAWDAKKTAVLSQLIREGVRLGASNSPRLPAPPLSLPDPVDADFDTLESEAEP